MSSRRKRQTPASALLAWYGANRRDLPWRAQAGESPDPWRVLLSEVMLQQTTVAAVAPYFRRFVALWPDVCALAGADDGDVMREWAGLGYYARARNLLAAARAICHGMGGRFPETAEGLRALPGIGPYTANAVAAIAFNEPVMPVDAGIARITSRLFAVDKPLPGAMPELRLLAQGLCPRERPGDFCQAMMDLGAAICTPRVPRCTGCPLLSFCLAGKAGIAENLPVKAKKAARPVEHGVFYLLMDARGRAAALRRPAKGIWGGLMEVPSSGWRGARLLPDGFLESADWEDAGNFRHVFTHFTLEMEWRAGRLRGRKVPAGLLWLPLPELAASGLPSPMTKALRRIHLP